MADLPDDWTPPPRGIISVTPAAAEHGGGILIGCDCGTTTHLVIEDIEHLPVPMEAAFTCEGCGSVHWFKAGPVAGG